MPVSEEVSRLHRQMEAALDHLENDHPDAAKQTLLVALGIINEPDTTDIPEFWIVRLPSGEAESLLKRLTRAKAGASRHRYIMNKERGNE